MGDKGVKLLIVIVTLVLLLGVVVTGIIFFTKGGISELKDELLQTEEPETVEYVYVQDTEQIRAVTFLGSDTDTISYEEDGMTKSLPMGDTILVLCTDEDLQSLDTSNYYQEEGNYFRPQRVSDIVPSGEMIAIVTSYKEGVSTAHTLVLKTEHCPEAQEFTFF